MNEHEIDKALEIAEARYPDLAPYARFLRDWRDIVNENSDGWPYWPVGTGAAIQLQVSVNAMVQHLYNPAKHPLPTVAEMKRDLAPIRAAARKHNLPEPVLVERQAVPAGGSDSPSRLQNYEVRLVVRTSKTYLVPAATPEDAESQARAAFESGVEGIDSGEEDERVVDAEVSFAPPRGAKRRRR